MPNWFHSWVGAVLPRTARSCSAVFAFVLLGLPAVPSLAAEDSLSALKVAFIYRFTSFIDWPEAAPGAPFSVCVIADPSMGRALSVLARQGRAVGDRPIRILQGDVPLADGGCEILFIGSAAEHRLADILAQSAAKPTLLLGDTPGLARRGVAIELFQRPTVLRNRLRLGFRINPRALKGRGLMVSAQLYQVGEVVE
jgi:hypothetical protein